MGGRTPESCWAVNKRQDNKLGNCCIWLVIYLRRTQYFHIASILHSVNEYKKKWNVRIGELSAVITEQVRSQTITLLNSVWEAYGFNLCWNTDSHEVYHGFPRFMRKIPSYAEHRYRQRSLHTISFTSHSSLITLHSTLKKYQILTAFATSLTWFWNISIVTANKYTTAWKTLCSIFISNNDRNSSKSCQ